MAPPGALLLGLLRMSDPLVLAGDTAFMSNSELKPGVRRAAGCQPGDWLLTRTQGRAASVVLSGELAALLRMFQQPTSITTAVDSFCSDRGLSVEEILGQVRAPLRRLQTLGYLRVANGSSVAGTSTMAPPGPWRVEAEVQNLDDARVFRVMWRGWRAALKIVQCGAPTAALVRHEAQVIGSLPDGPFAPLLEAGKLNGHEYLLTKWIDGEDALSVCNTWRRADPEAVLRTCLGILDAYACLETVGWLHGDVHPRNVLTASNAVPTLIDFGRALRPAHALGTPRAGINYFLDPQYAGALLKSLPLPPYGQASEQYAVAALIQLLLTGRHYIDFRLGRRDMLQQIAQGSRLPLGKDLAPPLAALERSLACALDKEPERRFPTIQALADAARKVGRHPGRRATRASQALGFVHGSIRELAWRCPSAMPRSREEAAVHHGAAGLAYAQYRMARFIGDPLLLASSAVWIGRALQAVQTGSADGHSRGTIALSGSLHHGPAGVHVVAGLIAAALNDQGAVASAVNGFLAAEPNPADGLDVTHGLAGNLLGCALLLEHLPDIAPSFRAALQQAGERVARIVWSPGAPVCVNGRHGVAHGEAGRLYSRLRWDQVRQVPPSPPLVAQVSAIFCDSNVECELKRGRTCPAFAHASWCNGSAGHLILLLLAAELTGEPRFGERATSLAEATWDDATPSACLCCGEAGRAFGMLAMFRATGDAKWAERAGTLAERAGGDRGLGSGLYKGRFGVELVQAELLNPSAARMPLFA